MYKVKKYLNDLKIADVISILKKDPLDKTIYRPINKLPTV